MTPATPGGLVNILAATRMLLGAWDATLSHWEAPAVPLENPAEPAAPLPLPAEPAAAGAVSSASLSVQMLDGLQIWIDARPAQDLPRGKAIWQASLWPPSHTTRSLRR